MPYCRDGDLFGIVVQYAEESGGEIGMPEPVARFWFRQILMVRFDDENSLAFICFFIKLFLLTSFLLHLHHAQRDWIICNGRVSVIAIYR